VDGAGAEGHGHLSHSARRFLEAAFDRWAAQQALEFRASLDGLRSEVLGRVEQLSGGLADASSVHATALAQTRDAAAARLTALEGAQEQQRWRLEHAATEGVVRYGVCGVGRL